MASEFLEALALRESSNNQHAINPLRYIGLYQLSEAALIDAGYIQNDGRMNNNYQDYVWTEKANAQGVSTYQDFLNSTEVQLNAVIDFHKKLEIYLKVFGAWDFIGQDVAGVTVTESGLLAAAHLVGAKAAATWLKSNGNPPADGNGVTAGQYLAEFNGLGIDNPNNPGGEVGGPFTNPTPNWIGTPVPGDANGNGIPDILESARTQFITSRNTSSPIILDLDGDGVETTSVNAGVWFDHDANGFAESTGWMGSDDGLLVRDLDGNGRIDSGRELFGSETLLANGQKAANGFAALAQLDSNGDGRIDNNDDAWDTLKIWKDADGDGYTSEGELLTMEEAGVQSLNIAYTNSSSVDANGNQHKQLGSYTRTDGTTASASDVWFNTDRLNSIAESWLEVPEDIAGLPDLRGYGNVYDLQQAMVRDASGEANNDEEWRIVV